MDKKKVIQQMVKNYHDQVKIVGFTSLTLEDYLRGIMFRELTEGKEGVWTEDDLAYGLSLKQ